MCTIGAKQVRGPLARELADPLAEVGLDRADAGMLERLVEADLLETIDLPLATSVASRRRATASTASVAFSAVLARTSVPPFARSRPSKRSSSSSIRPIASIRMRRARATRSGQSG